MEEDLAVRGKNRGKGAVKGVQGHLSLAVDELAADVVSAGEAGDGGAGERQ